LSSHAAKRSTCSTTPDGGARVDEHERVVVVAAAVREDRAIPAAGEQAERRDRLVLDAGARDQFVRVLARQETQDFRGSSPRLPATHTTSS
jgi:hypothetical protein